MSQVMRKALLVSILIHLVALFSFRIAPLLLESSHHTLGKPIDAILVSVPLDQSRTPPFENASSVVGQPVVSGVETLSKSKNTAKPSIFPSISQSTVTDDVAVTERAPAATDVATPAPNSVAVASDTISLDGVRQYRLNLAREARRFKRYPELARERGWEGVVVVVVNTVAGAATPLVSLSQSSGFEQLDLAALELLEMAVESAVLPESLRGRQFGLTLPVDYRLGD